MFSADEITNWQEADKVLTVLLELNPDQRDEAVTQLKLSTEVRNCVEQLLRANKAEGLLDRKLAASVVSQPTGALRGQLFGTWRLSEEIGRGGMAVVYSAQREGSSFEQQAAVKLLPRGMTGHERFETEQRVMAQLEHPNIARMLDGGVAADGTPWLAMELVAGTTIDQHCKNFGLREKVQQFLEVIEAVSYAHSLLVVHRDLKPGNVLVDQSGRTRLLDFGIAKLMQPEDSGTATRVLTSQYAAPEQFDGQRITTATDVFGLGALLHALITGQPPRDRNGSFSNALESGPADRDLKNIIRKALREDPADRYTTAQAMGLDLQRWLDGFPVAATAGSRRYRAGKWFKRHSLAALATSLALLALVAAVFMVIWQARETEKQLQISQASTEFLVGLFEEADPAIAQGQSTTARDLLGRAESTLVSIQNPDIRDQLTIAISRAYFGMGDFNKAKDLLQSGLVSEMALQPLPVQLLYAKSIYSGGSTLAAIDYLDALPAPGRNSLEVRTQLGRYLATEALYERADAELSAAESAIERGTDAKARIALFTASARNHIFQGRYDPALEALAQGKELANRATLWSEQAEIARMSGEVAEIQGRHEDALNEYVAAREVYERIYSPDHSIMIDIAKAEAQALRNLGQHQQAYERLQAALAIAMSRLGDHPMTVDVLNSMSIAEEQLGDLQGAIRDAGEAEAMMVRLGNGEHPMRANLLANTANYYITLGQFDRAEELTLQAEAILRNTLPDGHPVFIHTQFQLARILSRKLETRQALVILQQLLPQALESPGPGNHLTISIMRDLARQHQRLGELEPATHWFEEAAEAAKGFPEDSLLRVYIELALAENYLLIGKTPQARTHLEPYLASLGSDSEQPDGQVVYTEALLAFHEGDSARANRLLRRVDLLMSEESDGGSTYKPEVQSLARSLGQKPEN